MGHAHRWIRQSRILVILIMMTAPACLLFGVVSFAGLKASIALTLLAVPLFNLGRFIARRNRTSQPDDGSK
jgi:hypothetical protein